MRPGPLWVSLPRRGHGRDNDQGAEDRGHAVKERHCPGRLRHVRLFGEVGPVDQGAVPCHRQREERLSQSVDPYHGVQQSLRLQDKDVAVAVRRAGQGGNVDGQPHEQAEEQGHHHLVGPLDAAADAKGHDEQRARHSGHLPAGVAPGGRRGVEIGGECLHPLVLQRSARKGRHGVLQNPTNHHGIADGHGQRARHRDEAQSLAPAPPACAPLCRRAEGRHGSAGCGPAEGHLADDAGGGNQHHKDHIGDQEGGPAVGGHPGWKQPDVPHPHRGADAGQLESPAGPEAVPSCLFHDFFLSSLKTAAARRGARQPAPRFCSSSPSRRTAWSR